MIKTLPSLPSTWAYWDWFNSNGEATVQQTMAASDACLYQGPCSDFSRYVWNDMVTCVANVVEAVGLTWDDTYGDIESCKISERLGALTASAFNGVALNIHNFRFVKWKWSVESDLPGYVGRDAFRGYSQYGKESDHLYGWYIFELAVKLNKVIEVLKEEADFSEFENLSQISTSVSAEASSINPTSSEAHVIILSKENVMLATARTLEAKAVTCGFSFHNGILIPNRPRRTKTDTKIATYPDASAEGICTEPMVYIKPIETYVQATMKELLYIGYLIFKGKAETSCTAELSALNILEAVVSLQSFSNVISQLVSDLPIFLGTQAKAESFSSSDLINIASLPFVAKEHGVTFNTAEPIILNPAVVESMNNISCSYQRSVLSRIYPLYVKGSWYVSSLTNANGEIFIALPMDSINHSQGIVKADSISLPATFFNSALLSKLLLIANMNIVRPVYATASQLCISECDATIKLCDVVRAETKEKSVSTEEGTLIIGKPKFSEAAEHARTYHKSAMVRQGSKCLVFKEESNTSHDATLNIGSPQEASLICVSGTTVICEMDLQYAVHEVWHDPVRTGNNLYIRSAYPQWREGNNVHLDDSGVYYDAVQAGSNVYIRSKESMKEVVTNG